MRAPAKTVLAGLVLLGAALAMAPVPANAQETVVVANRVIYPGETVKADSIDEVPLRRRLQNPGQFAFQPEQVEGKVARRTLLPGRLVPLNSVRAAYLVEPGAPVQMVFAMGHLEISTSAVPLQAGAAGDLIRLRNIDSGAVVTGQVMDDGTVRVPAS